MKTEATTFDWKAKLPRNGEGWWVVIEQLPVGGTITRRITGLRACALQLPADDGEFSSHVNRYNRWTRAENEFARLFAAECVGDMFSSVLINPDEEDEGETRTITVERGQVVR